MSSPAPFNDARTLVLASALVPSANIAWPNEPFAEPATASGALWIAVDCTSNDLSPVELGGGVWQESGVTYIHVNVPARSGSDMARLIAKSFTTVFRDLGARGSGFPIYHRASIGNGVASDPQGIWWTLTVTLDWVYQDIDS